MSVWKKRRGRAHEVAVSPRLIGDPKGMLATLLHEAAHAMLWDAGKNGGMGSTEYYHTKIFRDQAIALGLCCEFLNTRYGWTLTSWPSDRVPKRYKGIIPLLRSRLPAGPDRLRLPKVDGQKLPSSGHTMLVCQCSDDLRTVYVKKSMLEEGGIECSFCGTEFQQP